MEDDALGFFKKSSTSHARLNVPALVQVAALAIIMIRCLDLLMIFNTLGFRGTSEFIHRSVQTWNLTLVFLGSLVLLFIEIYRQRLSVGCFAGLRISRTVQYCGGVQTRNPAYAGDAKTAGYAGIAATVCSCVQQAVLPFAITCIILAPG